MGLRETLEEKPALGWAIGAVLLVLALIVIVYQFLPARAGGPTGEHAGFHYTTDAGTTWQRGTPGEFYTLGPDGNPRVRVRFFRWEDTGETFVGYLERAPAEVIQRRQRESQGPPQQLQSGRPEMLDVEVAQPGAARWFPRTSRQGQAIITPPKREDGTSAAVVS